MARPKILLVDDSRHFIEMEKAFLKECAVMIYTATSGAEALEILSLVKPDVVFLDLYMPGMDGAECCAALKADPDLRSVPVVIVTSSDTREDRDRCLSAGCDGLISKPVNRKAFLEYGHRFLSNIDVIELRVPCRTAVMMQIGEECMYGTAANVSTHGLFVVSAAELEIDDRVMLSFLLPGDSGGVIEAAGRVAWINNGLKQTLPEGFGIEFLQIAPDSVEMIRKFMDGADDPLRHVEEAYVAAFF